MIDKRASYGLLQRSYEHMRDLCRQAQDGWTAERRKLWAAEAKNERLRAALEPFAVAGADIANGKGVWVAKPFDGYLMSEHFERARAALAKDHPTGGEHG